MKRSALIWQGASVLTGEDISLFCTPPATRKANQKTGAMVQTYVVPTRILEVARKAFDAGATLNEAAKAACRSLIHGGFDRISCLDCPHRSKAAGGAGTCYTHGTTIWNGLRGVLKTWLQFRSKINPAEFVLQATEKFTLRMGTYGEPVHVPIRIWDTLLQGANGHTGYTHQWKRLQGQHGYGTSTPALSWWKNHVNASCDTFADLRFAQQMGWKGFLITPEVLEKGKAREAGVVLCPASNEGGKRVTCQTCLLCQGAGRPSKSVYIPAHAGVLTSQVRKFISELAVIQ